MSKSRILSSWEDNIKLLHSTAQMVQAMAWTLRIATSDAELVSFLHKVAACCSLIHSNAGNMGSYVRGPAGDALLQKVFEIFERSPTVSPRFTELADLQHGGRQSSAHPRLEALNQQWNEVRKGDLTDQIDFIGRCLNFPSSSRGRIKFLQAFQDLAEELTARHVPALPSLMTLKELLLYPVSSAARSITNALIASAQCRCGREHEYNALFGLDTCRRLDTRQNDGRSIEFDIFLSADFCISTERQVLSHRGRPPTLSSCPQHHHQPYPCNHTFKSNSHQRWRSKPQVSHRTTSCPANDTRATRWIPLAVRVLILTAFSATRCRLSLH